MERPDLGDVLEFYGVHDRKRMIPCPLHEDGTPSNSVNYSTGLWNCHSCGQGGTSWDLIMQKEGLDFSGAKAFAEAHDFTSEAGSGEDVYRSKYGGGGRSTSKRKSTSPKSGGGYTPSWRKR